MIDTEILASAKRTIAFHLQWPRPGNPGAILGFAAPEEWIAFLSELDLSPYVPQIVSTKYRRAQRLYALSWLDLDLVKAGELVSVTALELALKDRYAGQIQKRNPMFSDLLQHLVMKDGLASTEVNFTRLYGGKVANLLYESDATRDARKRHQGPAQPTLLSIRNGLAHGDPFDGLPWGGLLELIRDLIEYAYRQMIAEGQQYRAR